jgi:hypothetical protein
MDGRRPRATTGTGLQTTRPDRAKDVSKLASPRRIPAPTPIKHPADRALLWLVRGASDLPDGALYPMAAVLLQRRVDADLIAAIVDLEMAVMGHCDVDEALANLHALPRVPGRGDRALRRVGDNMLANPTRMPVTVLAANAAGWTMAVDVDGVVSESEPGRVTLDAVAVYVPVGGPA